MAPPEPAPESYSIKSPTGAEIIMPNPIKEKFDSKEVTSFKDVIYG